MVNDKNIPEPPSDISDEMVERGAKQLHSLSAPTNAKRKVVAWDKQMPEYRDVMREKARAVLEAALNPG